MGPPNWEIPTTAPPVRRRRSAWPQRLLFLALIAAVAAAFWWTQSGSLPFGLDQILEPADRTTRPVPAPDPLGAEPTSDVASRALPDPLPPPLPDPPVEPLRVEPPPEPITLTQSDAPLRARARERGLDGAPLVQRGLEQPDLVWRISSSIVDITQGVVPRSQLRFLGPGRQAFSVQEGPDGPSASPESYARYDAVVRAFESLDARELVRLYREVEPVFDDAYGRLGYPRQDFDSAIAEAIRILLATPQISPSEPLLPSGGVTYIYADPEIEALLPVQRQLLRMGPQNLARVHAKLREIAAALRVPVLRDSPAANG